MAQTSTKDIIQTLEDLFAKAPTLPTNAKEAIVKITPLIAIIFGILGVLISISGLGALTFLAPFAAIAGARNVSTFGMGFIGTLFWLAASVCMIVSYSGLKARKISGWNLLFWSEVINLGGSLVTFSFFSGIIGALIGFYLLFQIKSYYK